MHSILLLLCLALPAMASENDPATQKTLKILQLHFEEKDPKIQRTLLRNMALLDTNEAIPFFTAVALDARYTDEIRRESLKGLIAMDSKKYKSVLEPLQETPLQDDHVIRTVQLLEGIQLCDPAMQSLSFKEEKKIVDMKISVILNSWKPNAIAAFNFKKWPSQAASENLLRLVETTERKSQKIHLIELWSKVRDEKSTKEMVKLLDQNNPEVQEAVIQALSSKGSNTASALGRFLQKSKNAKLRKKTIEALKKINTESSRVALRSYSPKATTNEKKWIDEALEK